MLQKNRLKSPQITISCVKTDKDAHLFQYTPLFYEFSPCFYQSGDID